MSRPVIYIAITNHGFGHATRTAGVAATIQKFCPDVLLAFVTTAPRWLLESYLPNSDFIHRPRSFDVGVVQSDSLTMDKAATLEKLKQIRDRSSQIISAEANFIAQNKACLVLADIPPLATAIAVAAGVPCWMMSNFGWDLIYREWGGEFVEMADWISQQFAKCDRLYRYPWHEPMSAFKNVIDVGLTGGDPGYDEDTLREKFRITAPPEQTILLTFGGLGLAGIPYGNLARFPDWQFITFDRQAPDLPNLIKVMERAYRPVDFMPLCGRVVSKPGFGTFSEACRVGVPIVTITREGFAETPFLLEGIQNNAEHLIVSPAEFAAGAWSFLSQPMQPPRQAEPLPTDGNTAIAQAVADYIAQGGSG
ncbi:MAG: glycosyl transferase [Thainema sp.]